ncbi:Fur family ferric uptake transcriptional regulator/Fur family peroxide stress response transcriptional regulator [Desulfitispora alkaliphila]|uniref:Fur family transcriptional regulator n=1 Tax=Desulfitispora alkaliphila TaxID=622674 RepID=UPI003D24AA35
MTKKIGTRMTKQKKIILEILRNTTCHPTADWIYEQAKKELPDISLGTVYRNLKLLSEVGEIAELNYGSTYRRFDGNAENHYHFACEECDNVYDIDLPLISKLDHKVEEAIGGKVNYHRIEFYGVCKNCIKSN